MNPEIPSDLKPKVAELLRQGQKIGAIKLVRESMGLGLKEAKKAVEDFAQNELKSFPSSVSSSESDSSSQPHASVKKDGCLLILALPLLTSVATISYFIFQL